MTAAVRPRKPEFRGTTRFELISRLGTGGMGVVYQAFDREHGTHVALKTLRELSSESLFRLKSEFRALQDITHPNIVHLGELCEDDGYWFFTMELVSGVDLLEHVRGASPAMRRTDSMSGRPRPAQSEETAPTQPVGPTSAAIEGRVRAVLPQLARGLYALHRAGKVHRDVKPSNVRVTPDGRVVLLDFGLIADVAQGPVTERAMLGTAAYVAPEQAMGAPVGPAADWYGVGVVLFEALTGVLPFTGKVVDILDRKQLADAPSVHERAPGVSEDLGRLCAELLRRDPAARPGGKEVLERITERRTPRNTVVQMPAPAGTPFIGRVRELANLADALEDTRRGMPVVAAVHGPSGVGKTALVRRFLGAAGPVTVLEGRCYQRESVPYKALDAIVDSLSRLTGRLPAEEAARVTPADLGPLAQIFPVIGRPPSRDGLHRADPHGARTRAFGVLREWLARLAERRPLVLFIDDLQWADDDSGRLLREVLGGPGAPALLLCVTCRPGASVEDFVPAGVDTRRIELAGLPKSDARELCGLLLQRAGVSGPLDPAPIVEATGGHPLFMEEMIRHRLASGGRERVALDEALWARLHGLDSAARSVLEVVAVAAGPVLAEAAACAAGLDPAAFASCQARLRSAHLVKPTRIRGWEALEPHHDLVREVVAARLTPETLALRHRLLAEALEGARVVDHELLAHHWRSAGDPGRAIEHALAAAADAEDALAFDRAARLYQTLLELRGEDAELLQCLGTALANAGRGAEAARAFLRAARLRHGLTALDLERAAAEQLLKCGRLDEGIDLVRQVLGRLGLRLPESALGAAGGLVVARARLRLGELLPKRGRAGFATAEDLTRVDVCCAIAVALGTVELIRGMHFQAIHMQEARRLGDPDRLAKALALEAPYLASTPAGRPRAHAVLAEADALAQSSREPRAVGMATAARAWVALQEGRWRRARELGDRAEEIFRDRCGGTQWELNTIRSVSHWALVNLGRLDELARRVPGHVREAEQRGDVYAAANHRLGLANMAWLAMDDPAGARREARLAIESWSRRGFHIQHAFGVLAEAQIDLYEGLGPAACERVERSWPALRGSLFLVNQLARIGFRDLRGRVALAAGRPADAARAARQLAREGEAWSRALGRLLESGVARHRGDVSAARAAAAAAAADFEDQDMPLHAAIARWRAGDETALTWLTDHRIHAPEKLARVLSP